MTVNRGVTIRHVSDGHAAGSGDSDVLPTPSNGILVFAFLR